MVRSSDRKRNDGEGEALKREREGKMRRWGIKMGSDSDLNGKFGGKAGDNESS